MSDQALREALREALNLIDSINDCHGCLDNGPEDNRAAVDRLRALAAAEPASEPLDAEAAR